MVDIFSASGFLVHTPCGPRKSGMPESVEMPAPVSTTTRRASSIQAVAAWRRSRLMVGRIVLNFGRGVEAPQTSREPGRRSGTTAPHDRAGPADRARGVRRDLLSEPGR